MLIIHLRKNAFSLRIRRGTSHKLSIRAGRGTFLLMLCKTLPTPFDVLKFDILTRKTESFFCGSGRALEFYKTMHPYKLSPVLSSHRRSLGRYFTARPRFSLVCTTQLNLIIACVSGAGLFFSAMEEISPLRVLS